MKTTSCALPLVLVALGPVGCSSATDSAPPAPPSMATVALEGPIDTLRSLGQQLVVRATVLDSAGVPSTQALTWSSSDPSVITVSTTGLITALANGSAEVMASLGFLADTVTVTVAQRATSLVVTVSDTLFNPGVRARVTAVAKDSAGAFYERTPLEWISGAPTVVAMEPGFALPLGPGDAVITVRAGDTETSRTLTVVDDIALGVPQAVAELFQWTMEDSALANGVVGTSVTILLPGVGTWAGVFGQSSPTEVMRPDMLFYPGSILKVIDSSVLLSLVNDGLLLLSDTIGQWLAPFQNPNIPTGVTVQQLLQNTSGIFSFTSHPTLADSLLADPNRVWDPRAVMETFVLTPDFAPSTAWRSSNSGYVLAGLIAEAVTGSTMPELLRSRVFGAMGLGNGVAVASFEVPASPVAATWRGPVGGPLFSSADLQTTSAHTLLWPQTIISSAALAQFGRALFGDFLSPALRSELLTAVPDDGAIPNQVGAGIGIRKYDFLGRTQWGHSGSQGAGSGFLLWDVSSGIVIAMLYNQSGASHGSSHFKLLPVMLDLALKAMP